MPSMPAATAARIRLVPIGATSAWPLPSGSTSWTVTVVGASAIRSETAEVLARLPRRGVVGGGMARDLGALDAREPVGDLRRERAHQHVVARERVERLAEVRRQRLAAFCVRRAGRGRRHELALDAVEPGVNLRR